jgi:hypothetical protein
LTSLHSQSSVTAGTAANAPNSELGASVTRHDAHHGCPHHRRCGPK